MSLKDTLHNFIKEKGYVTYSELIDLALAEGYRPSNAERRLRELVHEFPIEAIEKKSKRGSYYICGYRLKETKPDFSIIPPTLQETAKKLGFADVVQYFKFPDYMPKSNEVQGYEIVGGVLKVGGKEYPIFSEKKEQKEIKESQESKDPNRTNTLF